MRLAKAVGVETFDSSFYLRKDDRARLSAQTWPEDPLHQWLGKPTGFKALPRIANLDFS
jgi:hypothetical protein